jgi:hypothetical protein
MKDFVFHLGFATLFAHELDSVLNHEWRVIPVIRSLPDETGAPVFVAAHIPVFAILVALVASRNIGTRRMARAGIGLFLILHGLLHVLFMNHPAYEFSTLLSNTLIFGGSILGIMYLFLEWLAGKRGDGTTC